jgi:hypothetical protein
MSAVLRPLRREARISDPDLAEGARLLSFAQPASKSEARKRRVWNALHSGSPSRFGFKLTALHVAFASVLFAAVSSAAVGGYYVQHRETTVSLSHIAGPAAAVAPARARAAHAKPATPAPVTAAVPAAADAVAANDSPATAQRPAPARRLETSARHLAPDTDAELLVEAMRARSSGDAKRVSELTERYRAKHPQGALQEEALILAIESAATRHAASTSALAREYLARFPSGRFAQQARRAAADSAP